MVTGDHPGTAAAIAKEVKILSGRKNNPHDLVLPAGEFDALSQHQLDNMRFLPAAVARCSPATKVTLIEALHRRGRVVAMTGTYTQHIYTHTHTDIRSFSPSVSPSL
jgi:magnesium-transporting ATPase (P-type)